MGLLVLTGCSEDSEDSKAGVTVELVGFVADYQEVNEAQKANEVTRAWTPYEGYSVDPALADNSITVFFTQKENVPTGGYEEEYFFKSGDKWRVSKTDLAADTYFLYGYMPHDPSITPTVEVLGEGKTFEDGAVLTLTNMPTVTAEDLCVMVGAKNGTDDSHDNGLRPGDFTYVAQLTQAAGETPKGNNYVFLLFDHIYSAISYNMRVKIEYNNLRTIKLKGLSLQTFTGAMDPTKKKTNAVIKLKKTEEGGDPITSIVFEGNGTQVGAGGFYQNADGEELNTDYKTFQGNFMPQGVTKLVLTSKYDVYDKQGNLIRQDCEATNTLDIKELFRDDSAKRGRRYTLNLTIQPTYLYVLSEPDLDNPTVVVE